MRYRIAINSDGKKCWYIRFHIEEQNSLLDKLILSFILNIQLKLSMECLVCEARVQ